MYDRYFSGLKLSSAALALLLIAAGLYFGACSSDKGEKKEVEETESVEVEVEAPAGQKATEAPSGETGKTEKQTREGLPPEITEPCSGKNEGDPCAVVITGGARIKGTCKMTRKNILGCNPTPIIGTKKPAPDMSPADDGENPESQ